MLTKEEIIDLASRYVEEKEITQFPFNGDLFCFVSKKVDDKSDKWAFNGYGICQYYDIDYSKKPEGAWLILHYASLNEFPPTIHTIFLQPPHVVKSQYQSTDRSKDIRLLNCSVSPESAKVTLEQRSDESVTKSTEIPPESASKILKFRSKSFSNGGNNVA